MLVDALALLRRHLRISAGRCASCDAALGSPLCKACRDASGIGSAPFSAKTGREPLHFVGAYRSLPPGGDLALSPLGRTIRAFKDRGDRYGGRCLADLFAT